MKFRMSKMIGETKYDFEEVAENPLEFFQKASLYAELPSLCGHCQSKEISLGFMLTKEGYRYAKIRCHACKYELSFGQRRDGKGDLFQKGWNPASTEQRRESVGMEDLPTY